MDELSQLKWWEKAVFYQIYPYTFSDGNEDGIGDFKGMIAHLDYLKDLGVDAIWLSPHYPSPGCDCGYDISDYQAVAPEFGILEDFKAFLDGLHQRGMHLILDLVLNHTSDQHAWFKESRSSKNNPKCDWYVWRDGHGGNHPNNWQSGFGGTAWEYESQRDQYYYHYFLTSQPDLNWRNLEVKEAMFEVVRFWLDMGVDGFRLDAIGTIFEHPDFPNHNVPMSFDELGHASERAKTEAEREKLNKYWAEMFKYQLEQLEMHPLMQELRQVIDEYDDRLLVGEDDHITYHGSGDDELHMVFNFPLMRAQHLTPTWVRENQKARLAELAEVSPQAWAANTLGNHDSPRVLNRYGDGVHDDELARLSLALLLTLRGTPFLYYGEEIGMVDLYLEDITHFRDTIGVWRYETDIEAWNITPEEALYHAARFTRDKNRTPMQWTAEPNAGFSPPGMKTWLPVNPNYALGINVEQQQKEPGSLFNFYREMLSFRKRTPALIGGDFTLLHEDAEDYLAFTRSIKGQICMVILNMSSNQQKLSFIELPGRFIKTLFSSVERPIVVEDLLELIISPFEIFIGELI